MPDYDVMASKDIVIEGAEIAIGNRRHPIADIVAIVSTASGISVMFRDGSVDLGNASVADFFTIRDRCPWVAASI